MNRRVVLVIIAIALALTGTVVVYAYVKHADKRALADTRVSHVLVVQTQIPAGTSWSDIVKGTFVKRETVPTTAAPEDAIASVDDTSVDGSEVATAVIQPGQLLLHQMFNDQATVTGVLAIPKGMVAISVTLQSSSEVAGYVQPQSVVGVFLTVPIKSLKPGSSSGSSSGSQSDTSRTVTKLLATNVRVIATSAAAPTDVVPATGGRSGGSVLLTLAVTQLDAQRIIEGQSIGNLYLALLSKDSQTSTDMPGTSSDGKVLTAPILVK